MGLYNVQRRNVGLRGHTQTRRVLTEHNPLFASPLRQKLAAGGYLCKLQSPIDKLSAVTALPHRPVRAVRRNGVAKFLDDEVYFARGTSEWRTVCRRPKVRSAAQSGRRPFWPGSSRTREGSAGNESPDQYAQCPWGCGASRGCEYAQCLWRRGANARSGSAWANRRRDGFDPRHGG